MKKNKLMRFASLLLIATLLTTSVISGTFAKYVTTDSAKDTARVAKFGVVASIEGNLFGASYSAKTSNPGDTIQTWSKYAITATSNTVTDKILAPGTTGDTMTFSISGTPEVSTKVTFETNREDGVTNLKYYSAEPKLKAGDYGVMVEFTGVITKESIKGKYKSSDQATFTKVTDGEAVSSTTYYELQDATDSINADYAPVTWTYTLNGGAEQKTNSLKDAQDALKTAFQANGADKEFKPNEDNALSATLTWDWFFEGGLNDLANGSANTNSIYSDQDKADTILGDMIVDANGALGTGKYVVAKSGENYLVVKTANVKIMSDSEDDNKVTVAYTGTTAPTAAYSAEFTTSTGVIAVLGAAFDASLTVTQVD